MDLIKEIQTAIIIDDVKEEIEKLQEMLTEQHVYTTYISPEELESKEDLNLKNHQLIFMDFSLKGTFIDDTSNIALMRRILEKICGKHFGAYGLVVWTKHYDRILQICQKMSNDSEMYTTPLFIVGLDKAKYLEKGDYSTLMDDLNEVLKKNKAAAFFFSWRQSVEKGADKALNGMYSLVPDYTKQPEEFMKLLYLLADNYSGAPIENGEPYKGMTMDACKAFNELLHHDITQVQHDMFELFEGEHVELSKDPVTAEELEQMARINTKLLIDETKPNNSIITPGIVYRVKKEMPLITVPNAPKDSVPIAIELTPPCDFAHKKVSSRLIGGFIKACPTSEEKLYDNLKSFDAGNKYALWPIMLKKELKFICFDFRCISVMPDEELTNPDNFELLFTAKSRLFADILQKFSSHAARLGLSIIQPRLDNKRVEAAKLEKAVEKEIEKRKKVAKSE